MPKASMYFSLPDLHSKQDSAKIKQDLDAVPGIFSVSVNTERGKVAVDYDTTGTGPEQIRSRIQKCGFEIGDEWTELHVM